MAHRLAPRVVRVAQAHGAAPTGAAGQSLKGRNMGRASKRLCGNRRGVQVDRVATGWKAVAPIDAGPLEQVAIMRAYSAGRS